MYSEVVLSIVFYFWIFFLWLAPRLLSQKREFLQHYQLWTTSKHRNRINCVVGPRFSALIPLFILAVCGFGSETFFIKRLKFLTHGGIKGLWLPKFILIYLWLTYWWWTFSITLMLVTFQNKLWNQYYLKLFYHTLKLWTHSCITDHHCTFIFRPFAGCSTVDSVVKIPALVTTNKELTRERIFRNRTQPEVPQSPDARLL